MQWRDLRQGEIQGLSDQDAVRVARLRRKYAMLKQLLVEGRQRMAKRDPLLHTIAPLVDVYWAALDAETADKTLDEVTEFLNEELSKALREFGADHPIKLELQTDYLQEVPLIIQEAATRISKNDSFDAILDYLAQERYRLAQEYAHFPIEKFGKPRLDATHLYRTAFTHQGRYGPYIEHAMAMVPQGATDFRPPGAFDANWIPLVEGTTVWDTIGGQRTPLTTVLVCVTHPSDEMLEWLFGGEGVTYPSVAMVHTDIQFIPILKDYCRYLFGRARERPLSIEAVAELQWYLAHAMLYIRGSAAITEWLITAVFLASDSDVTWTSQPDLEALLTAKPQDFIERYRTFTQLSPHTV